MSCALATTGKMLEWKKQLLAQHTLEAVLSMPDELFINSKVGVVSCIMIFTAHKKHSSIKNTYFGYYKEDGFEKRKNKGRIDVDSNWKTIKKKWVDYYYERVEESGFSVKQIITAESEWCAESYMVTDYETINESDFIQNVLNYSAYLITNKRKVL